MVKTLEVLKEIIKYVNGPISGEVVSKTSEGMIKEAVSLASMHENVVVKIPQNLGLEALNELSSRGIKQTILSYIMRTKPYLPQKMVPHM